MKSDNQFGHLPGGSLVGQGIEDLSRSRDTIAASLVEIARGRLARAGLVAARESPSPIDWELRLYGQLRAEGGDAYSRYNSLLRELDSFARACERSRADAEVVEAAVLAARAMLSECRPQQQCHRSQAFRPITENQ